MLALDYIKANRETVERAIREKGVGLDLDALLELDTEVRAAKTEIDRLRTERNAVSARFKDATPEEKAELGRQAKEAGARASKLENELAGKEGELGALMLKLPGIPYEGAPVGPDESFNTVIRTEGRAAHVRLRAARPCRADREERLGRTVAGYPGVGQPHLLPQGRAGAARDQADGLGAGEDFGRGLLADHRPGDRARQAFLNQGQFPGHEEETYQLPNDELWLAGTAEVVLTSLHSGEIIEDDKLPVLYAGFSPCFRREAGSAGKDVRGLLRVHQFVKVEQYVICEADDEQSAEWHARLLELAESLLRELEIPYQVIETSTGDMGLGKYRMNDIESWVPSLGKYRETHSCSTLHDWQARRANIRYRGSDGKVRFAHTLNNTALASPRILVPLLENHQTGDGRVRLPKAMQQLMGREYL